MFLRHCSSKIGVATNPRYVIAALLGLVGLAFCTIPAYAKNPNLKATANFDYASRTLYYISLGMPNSPIGPNPVASADGNFKGGDGSTTDLSAWYAESGKIARELFAFFYEPGNPNSGDPNGATRQLQFNSRIFSSNPLLDAGAQKTFGERYGYNLAADNTLAGNDFEMFKTTPNMDLGKWFFRNFFLFLQNQMFVVHPNWLQNEFPSLWNFTGSGGTTVSGSAFVQRYMQQLFELFILPFDLNTNGHSLNGPNHPLWWGAFCNEWLPFYITYSAYDGSAFTLDIFVYFFNFLTMLNNGVEKNLDYVINPLTWYLDPANYTIAGVAPNVDLLTAWVAALRDRTLSRDGLGGDAMFQDGGNSGFLQMITNPHYNHSQSSSVAGFWYRNTAFDDQVNKTDPWKRNPGQDYWMGGGIMGYIAEAAGVAVDNAPVANPSELTKPIKEWYYGVNTVGTTVPYTSKYIASGILWSDRQNNYWLRNSVFQAVLAPYNKNATAMADSTVLLEHPLGANVFYPTVTDTVTYILASNPGWQMEEDVWVDNDTLGNTTPLPTSPDSLKVNSNSNSFLQAGWLSLYNRDSAQLAGFKNDKEQYINHVNTVYDLGFPPLFYNKPTQADVDALGTPQALIDFDSPTGAGGQYRDEQLALLSNGKLEALNAVSFNFVDRLYSQGQYGCSYDLALYQQRLNTIALNYTSLQPFLQLDATTGQPGVEYNSFQTAQKSAYDGDIDQMMTLYNTSPAYDRGYLSHPNGSALQYQKQDPIYLKSLYDGTKNTIDNLRAVDLPGFQTEQATCLTEDKSLILTEAQQYDKLYVSAPSGLTQTPYSWTQFQADVNRQQTNTSLDTYRLYNPNTGYTEGVEHLRFKTFQHDALNKDVDNLQAEYTAYYLGYANKLDGSALTYPIPDYAALRSTGKQPDVAAARSQETNFRNEQNSILLADKQQVISVYAAENRLYVNNDRRSSTDPAIVVDFDYATVVAAIQPNSPTSGALNKTQLDAYRTGSANHTKYNTQQNEASAYDVGVLETEYTALSLGYDSNINGDALVHPVPPYDELRATATKTVVSQWRANEPNYQGEQRTILLDDKNMANSAAIAQNLGYVNGDKITETTLVDYDLVTYQTALAVSSYSTGPLNSADMVPFREGGETFQKYIDQQVAARTYDINYTTGLFNAPGTDRGYTSKINGDPLTYPKPNWAELSETGTKEDLNQIRTVYLPNFKTEQFAVLTDDVTILQTEYQNEFYGYVQKPNGDPLDNKIPDFSTTNGGFLDPTATWMKSNVNLARANLPAFAADQKALSDLDLAAQHEGFTRSDEVLSFIQNQGFINPVETWTSTKGALNTLPPFTGVSMFKYLSYTALYNGSIPATKTYSFLMEYGIFIQKNPNNTYNLYDPGLGSWFLGITAANFIITNVNNVLTITINPQAGVVTKGMKLEFMDRNTTKNHLTADDYPTADIFYPILKITQYESTVGTSPVQQMYERSIIKQISSQSTAYLASGVITTLDPTTGLPDPNAEIGMYHAETFPVNDVLVMLSAQYSLDIYGNETYRGGTVTAYAASIGQTGDYRNGSLDAIIDALPLQEAPAAAGTITYPSWLPILVIALVAIIIISPLSLLGIRRYRYHTAYQKELSKLDAQAKFQEAQKAKHLASLHKAKTVDATSIMNDPNITKK